MPQAVHHLTCALFSGLVCLVTTIPCFSAPPTSRPQTRTSIKSISIDPMILKAKDGKVQSIEQLDLKALYNAAEKAFQYKKYKQSIFIYNRIRRYYPIHRVLYAALYNQALAHEELKQFSDAAQLYQEVLKLKNTPTQTQRNAQFRWAACATQQKQHQQAFQIYDQLLQTHLPQEDRLDALAYAGETLVHLQKPVQALPLFQLALALYHRTPHSEPAPYSVGMAQYFWAYIMHQRFAQRPFRLPQSRMKQDLEYKAQHLLKAQKLYLKTIQLRHADWALAAVYQIGKMYEQMYNHVFQAPIPKSFTQEERQIYQVELKRKVQVLLHKALYIYQRNLKFSQRLQFQQTEWVQKTQKSFQHLMVFYKKSFGSLPNLDRPNFAASQPASRKESKNQP
ncbi:MAG: hypothetical protein AAGJ35_00835 [Myxococcota bacterium]